MAPTPGMRAVCSLLLFGTLLAWEPRLADAKGRLAGYAPPPAPGAKGKGKSADREATTEQATPTGRRRGRHGEAAEAVIPPPAEEPASKGGRKGKGAVKADAKDGKANDGAADNDTVLGKADKDKADKDKDKEKGQGEKKKKKKKGLFQFLPRAVIAVEEAVGLKGEPGATASSSINTRMRPHDEQRP